MGLEGHLDHIGNGGQRQSGADFGFGLLKERKAGWIYFMLTLLEKMLLIDGYGLALVSSSKI